MEVTDRGECGTTMRIDIHPDFVGESLARRRQTRGDATRTWTTTQDQSGVALFVGSPDFQKLLQSIYDAVIITSFNGRIISFNSRTTDFLVCGDEALIGGSIIDVISGADESLLSAIRNNLEEHRYTLIEAHCMRSDRSLFPSEIAVNRLDLDDNGQLCFFIRDISVRKRAQEALEDAVARLEAHDRAKSQFVSNVSHELRTPLTSMIYAISNMLRGVAGPVPERVQHYLQILDGDCRRLLGTVNDILDLRKIDSKTLTLSKARVPFSRLVERTAESLRVQTDQKTQNLDILTPERVFVECDPHKMERVILNVVGNAVKFTPAGGHVVVHVGMDPERRDHVLLTVRDDGPGIPREALGRVTERYFTVGEQASGSGLGLAISKEIVELHGGSLLVASPPPGMERGTVVYVSMPMAEAPTILVVDDEPAILALLEVQLQAHGFHVLKASDGLQALEIVERERPNLVILDMVIPGMEGPEVILKMKSDKNTKRIPIIVVTGAEVGRARGQILSNFAIPALCKPWDENDLIDRVEGAFLGTAVLSK